MTTKMGLSWRKHGLSCTCVLIAALPLACSDTSALRERSRLVDQLTDTVDFTAFCQSWELTCPQGPAPNFPDEHQAYTPGQWRAAAAIGTALLGNAGELSITRDDLEADTLRQAVTGLSLDKWYDQLLGRIRSLGLHSVGVADSGLNAVLDAATVYTGKSNAKYNMDDTVRVIVDPAATLKISGMKISSPSGAQSQDLGGISVTGTNVGQLHLDPLEVQAVPLAFFSDEALAGIDLSGIKDLKLEMPVLARSMRPLLDWMHQSQSGRGLTLPENFFSVLRTRLPEWIPSDAARQTLVPLTQALSSLAVHLGTADVDLMRVNQVKNAKLQCNMTQGDQKMTIKFDAAFGVKSYEPLDDDSIRLEFFGIKATASAAMGMTITLGRVDITPEKIVIYNVPIVGQYEMKFADMKKSDENASVVCQK